MARSGRLAVMKSVSVARGSRGQRPGSAGSRVGALVFARRPGGAATGVLRSQCSSILEFPTWFLLLPDSGWCLWPCNSHGFLFSLTHARFNHGAGGPREGVRPGSSRLTLLCFSHVVPAGKLGNHPLKWLFVKEIYGLKWSLTPLWSAFVPCSSVGKQFWFRNKDGGWWPGRVGSCVPGDQGHAVGPIASPLPRVGVSS